ncbi:MAG: HEAT repeat domain-containing protein [Elusimicrobia bacterium]|nr:HEAT repeat domain-containing protein [Elusimicrobiota bacterium]
MMAVSELDASCADFLRCGHYRTGLAGSRDLSSGSALGNPDVQAALLGKEHRYAPDRSFDTLHVRLELRVDFARRRVEGLCLTRIRAYNNGLRTLVFDAVAMRILDTRWEGSRVRHHYDGKRLMARLPRKLRAGEESQVEIRYRLENPEVGLRFVPDVPGGRKMTQLWSQGEPEDSRYWFPCHDAPHQKATSEVLATVPAGLVAVSNGVLLEKSPGPRRATLTYHWRMNQPHALYLITLAVGRFSVVEERWEHVPLTTYCEKGREEDAKRGLGKTAAAMDFFSRSIGVPYPYEKYAQVCVKQFPGGMENTTAATMTEACLIDRRAFLDSDADLLVSHELAHQWFGDLLTCRDWSHAWLNEGFATYFEILFTRHDKGRAESDYELYRNARIYFQEDQGRYRRPVVTSSFLNPWVLFDRHLYEKGGWILHMLRESLGEELWWKAIGHYVRKHSHRSVVTEDLIIAIEEATGKNLRPFFDQWVFRSGYPSFKARWQWREKSRTAVVWLQQTQGVSDQSPAFRVDAEFRFEGRGWARDFSKAVSKKEHRWEFRLPGRPLGIEFDPRNKILKRAEFHKPLSMWLHQLRRGAGAVSRIEAAHEVAKWGGAASVAVLSGALRAEKFWGAGAEIAKALASIKTPAAYQSLTGFLRHPHPKVRRAVVEAVAEFRNPESARLLAPFARRDSSIFVESAAARGLAMLRDPKHAALFKSKLSQKSYSDVLMAGGLYGLAGLRDPRYLPLFRRLSRPPTSYPARAHAVRVLALFAQASEEVVGWLCENVLDPDERVAGAAIAALGQTEDPRALPALEKFLAKTHDIRLKTAAAEALALVKAGSETMGDPAGPKKS